MPFRLRSHRSNVLSAALSALVLTTPAALMAQDQTAPPPPQIITSATGEATVVPDRGHIYFAVETRAKTAAQAGADNARTQTAVIDAIKAKGVSPQNITTSGYSVGPEEEYPKGERKLIGYLARNTVVVDVQKIDQIGGLIDAALGAGANNIGGISYYSTQIEGVRRTALERAVARAKGDAEVLARAAGGTLGSLIELSVANNGMPRPMMAMVATGRAMADTPTPVEVGEQSVSVSVTARWSFVATK